MDRGDQASRFILMGEALQEVDDGIWRVTLMPYDLGDIGLEQKTLQPIDSPFGAEV